MSELTQAQRVERGKRAERAIEEFIAPEFTLARQRYLDRIKEVAVQELHPSIRADKITTLAVALRVLEEVESGVTLAMRDGEQARSRMLTVEKLENLSDARQRLIKIGGSPA